MNVRDAVGCVYRRDDLGSFVVVGYGVDTLDVWVLESGDLGRILTRQFLDGLCEGDVQFEATLSDLPLCPRCAGTNRLVVAHEDGKCGPAVTCPTCEFYEDLTEDTTPVVQELSQ
jgi:hypothetical protein